MHRPKNTLKLDRSNVEDTGNSLSSSDPKRLRKAYGDWITDTLTDYRNRDPAERCSSLDEYMTHNAFFVTCTFDRNRMAFRKHSLGLPRTDTTLEMDAFHYLYVALLRTVFGGHWANKKYAAQWPLGIVAMDHPEAKYGLPGENEISDLHWHAIIVSRSRHRAGLVAALHSPNVIAEFEARTLADSVDVRTWDPKQNPGYAIKAHVKSSETATAGLTDLRIYPNPSSMGRVGWGYQNSFGAPPTAAMRRLYAGLLKDRVSEQHYYQQFGAEAY